MRATGRVMTKRTSSAKLLFYDITGEGAKVQIMADLGCGVQQVFV